LKEAICLSPSRRCLKLVEKKQEFYIQNEDQMKNYILENGVEKVNLNHGRRNSISCTGNKIIGLD